jgi:hypothetical protein
MEFPKSTTVGGEDHAITSRKTFDPKGMHVFVTSLSQLQADCPTERACKSAGTDDYHAGTIP